MKYSHLIIRTVQVALLIFIAWGFTWLQLVSVTAQDSAVEPYVSSGIIDLIESDSGESTFLFRYGISNEDQDPGYQARKITTRFIRLFEHPTDPAAVLGVAWLGAQRQGIGIYEYKEGELRFWTHINERLRQPTFFQGSDGDIFIGSRTGVIYWVKPNRDLLRYQLKLPIGTEPDPRKMFRRIEFAGFRASANAESSGKGNAESNPPIVCAYSIADPKYHQRALLDIAVADAENGWRTIPLGGRATGPAVMTGPTTLRMLKYDRWLNVNLADETVYEEEFPIPQEAGAKVKPIAVTMLATGQLVSIWRKLYGSYKKDDLQPFQDGRYQKICEWQQEGERKWVPVYGKDQTISKQIVQAVDERGGWWFGTAEGNLVYRNSNGKYREFDYRSGIPTDSIQKLKMSSNGALLLFGSAAMKIAPKLLERVEPAEDKRWKEIFVTSYGGISYYGSKHPPGPYVSTRSTILLDSNLDREYEFPSPEMLPDREQVVAFEDNKKRPWLASTNPDDPRVFGFVEEQWTEYKISASTENSWEESVAEWLSRQGLVKEIDFLGARTAFGPAGRIAVVSRGRIALFDGEQWHRSNLNREFGEDIRYRPYSVWFNETALVAVASQNISFELPYYSWQNLQPDVYRSWKSTPGLFNLPTSYRDRRLEITNRLRKSPLFGAERKWTWQGFFNYLGHFTPEQMALFDGEHWTQVESGKSPFSATRQLTAAARLKDGGWVFRVGISRPYRIIFYRPANTGLRVEKSALGAQATPDSSLVPQWNSDVPLNDLKIRFKVDQGRWSEWQSPDVPVSPGTVTPRGTHELFVQLHCPHQILPIEPLRYTFDVTYDIGTQVVDLIGQLSAMDFETRKKAEDELFKMGPSIQKVLASQLESATDPEVRAALGRVLERLRDRNNDE